MPCCHTIQRVRREGRSTRQLPLLSRFPTPPAVSIATLFIPLLPFVGPVHRGGGKLGGERPVCCSTCGGLLPLPYTIWPVTVKAHGPIQRSALEQCAVWVEEIQPSEVEYDPGPHKAQRLPPAVLSTCAIKPDQYARDPTWQRSKLILGWKFSVRMVAFQRF